MLETTNWAQFFGLYYLILNNILFRFRLLTIEQSRLKTFNTFFGLSELPVTDSTTRCGSSYAASRGYSKMSMKFGSKCFRQRDLVSFVIFYKFFKNPDFSVFLNARNNQLGSIFSSLFFNPK